MTEKIEWYQEVFDIDPTSRIFLPLARLFKEAEEYERAVTILRRGLLHHSDMLEARLLLIVCLYEQGERALLQAEMYQVTELLKGYPVFFEAWAYVAQDQSQDLALTVSLLSQMLCDPSCTFVELLARGLTAYKALYANVPFAPERATPSAKPVATSSASSKPSVSSKLSVELLEDPFPDSLEELQDLFSKPLEDLPEPPKEQTTASVSSEIVSNKGIPLADLEADLDTQLALELATMTVPAEFEESTVADPDMFALNNETALNTDPDVLPSTPPDIVANPDRVSQANGTPMKPNADGMLRTMSMADLLAEQGSIDEAMAIYTELQTHEKDPVELANLHERIEVLRVQRGDSETTKTKGKDPTPNAPVKGRMLNVLESLAARLEARSAI